MESNLAILPIPFRAQETGWTCGAASLRMVYASFGLELTEAEIWHSLKPDPYERTGVNTSRLAWDAQRRGFSALAMRTKEPWRLIRSSSDNGIRLILQHPLTRGSPRRHFSVLIDSDEDGLVIHDPQYGASLRWARTDWLEHWGATHGNSSGRPNELVAITLPEPAPLDRSACPSCQVQLPGWLSCPRCQEKLSLRPLDVIACPTADCPMRLWSQILCSSCDYVIKEDEEFGPDGIPRQFLEKSVMPNGGRFSHLDKAMKDYQESLGQIQEGITDPKFGEMIASIQKTLKDSTEQLAESLNRLEAQNEATMKELSQKRIDAAKKLEEAKKAKAEALEKLAAKRAKKAAARPQPKQADEDPQLGEKLRDKLLEEFGTRVEQAPPKSAEPLGSLMDFDPGV